MGNKQTTFSEEQLENYVDTTFLTKTEVLRVFRRFCEIQSPPVNPKDVTYEKLKQVVVKYSELCKCPELKVIKVNSDFLKEESITSNFHFRKILSENAFVEFSLHQGKKELLVLVALEISPLTNSCSFFRFLVKRLHGR